MAAEEDERAIWLTEAMAVVDEWDRDREGLLTTREAALLADRIARGLQQAYERGRSQRQKRV